MQVQDAPRPGRPPSVLILESYLAAGPVPEPPQPELDSYSGLSSQARILHHHFHERKPPERGRN